MKWATAISRRASFEDAVRECAETAREDLGPGDVSLAFIFVTPHFAAYYPRVPGLVARYLGPEVLAGCSGGGVIGGGEEVEQAPAVTLIAARLPGVEVRPFRIVGELPDLDGPPDAWRRLIGVPSGGPPEGDPQLVMIADPFSVPTEALLTGLDYAFPGSPKVGGLASGGLSPGMNALFLGDEVFTDGAVGVSLEGNVAIDTVVAQGCRPIGETMRVTGCKGNLLYELDDLPAIKAVQELFSTLDDRDRNLAQTALFVGVLMDEFSETPGVGEFLIRNLIGVDPRRGAIAVGENLQEGMRLRFHLRDAETSADDLNAMLAGYNAAAPDGPGVAGALLFSCLGRGEGLYQQPNFDTEVFQDHLGDVPVGGFFCNGEIGPVGNTTFLHGYTSSFGLFRPRYTEPS
ncbi:MAG: FIST N-terminal domain-containing protein [Rubrobacteraceae bacterium]